MPEAEPAGAGADGTDTFPAVCAHTHLFPGARCRVQGLSDPGAFAADPSPLDVDLRFSDGVLTAAQLRTGTPAGAVLVVPAYTTAAGTSVDGRTWRVRELLRAGDEVEIAVAGLLSP
ncbi:hypothetical protein [Streptomyces similanensis]|uniref:Uncharacterized protein n=1 Tax=Streptomyces similanensis TaxID=1274988 RepID=A0ABP9K3W8_9ACTN